MGADNNGYHVAKRRNVLFLVVACYIARPTA
jgi:hypothetical protein